MFEHLAMWTWPDAIKKEEPGRMIERLRAAHVDIIMPYICERNGGPDERAVFESRLHEIIDEAHRHALQVQGCFDEMNIYDAMPVKHLHQVRKDGTPNTSLCPANPEARDYVLGELARVLASFDYDGITLEDGYVYHHQTVYDGTRQANIEYEVIPVCYCDYCQQHAPIEQPGWLSWKQERLTELIAAEAQLIRVRRPGIPFSAAARVPYTQAFYTPYAAEVPYYSGWEFSQARDGFAADWVEWLRRGLIDFACPMSYFHSPRMVELQTLECQSFVPDAAAKIWVGLGLDWIAAECSDSKYTDHAQRNGAATIAAQLDLLARMGQQNCCFFSYEFLLDEHIPVLAARR